MPLISSTTREMQLLILGKACVMPSIVIFSSKAVTKHKPSCIYVYVPAADFHNFAYCDWFVI